MYPSKTISSAKLGWTLMHNLYLMVCVALQDTKDTLKKQLQTTTNCDLDLGWWFKQSFKTL